MSRKVLYAICNGEKKVSDLHYMHLSMYIIYFAVKAQ